MSEFDSLLTEYIMNSTYKYLGVIRGSKRGYFRYEICDLKRLIHTGNHVGTAAGEVRKSTQAASADFGDQHFCLIFIIFFPRWFYTVRGI
jgi:hypothetical protein